MASATTPPVTTKTTTSVPPLYQEALAQAKAALAAQAAPIQNEQAASDANFKQQETDATGAAAAVSKLLQPIGPAVNNMYQTAAQNQELAANGFSQGMQDALRGNTDNLNAMLQKLGSPAQLDSHAQQAGDVLYGLGGFNPGRSFSQQGAAFGSAADLQAGDALLKGQENVKSLKAQSLLADQGFQNKIAELAGKLPGDVETNYQKLQSLALANKRFALAVQNQKFNQAAKIASQKLAVAKYNTSVDEFNSRQQMAAAKFARQQFQQDRQYQLDMASLGVRQKSLQLRIAQNAYTQAHGGFSQAKVAKFNSTMDALLAGNTPTRPVEKTEVNHNGGTSTSTGMEMPPPQFLDGKTWKNIGPDTVVPKGAKTRNLNTYAAFITAAVKKGVPVQLAINRANTIWPETQRFLPDSLKTLPAVAAEAAKQTADYNQMVGNYTGMRFKSSGLAGGFLPHGAKVSIERADQGRDIQTSPGMPIIAPGAGYVVRIASDPGGGGAHFGPSYPIVHFTSGPYAGKTMYIGHTTALVKPGQRFKPGTSLSVTGNGGPEAGGAPPGWAEIGFAPNGTPGAFGQAPPF